VASLRNRFFALSGEVIKAFTSFDGIQIAYHDQGEGRAVILLHGGFVDGLGQFGEFERILPILERRQEMSQLFGGALPLPDPPLEGRPGVARALLAAGARVVLPDIGSSVSNLRAVPAPMEKPMMSTASRPRCPRRTAASTFGSAPVTCAAIRLADARCPGTSSPFSRIFAPSSSHTFAVIGRGTESGTGQFFGNSMTVSSMFKSAVLAGVGDYP